MKIKLNKIKKPDFSRVQELVEIYTESLQEPEITSGELSDYKDYIFEAGIEAVYGKDCWDEINKILVKL